MRVEIDLLGGFAVRVDGRPVPPASGAAGKRRPWSSSSRWRRAGRCTASRSSTRCGPIPGSTTRRPGCTRPRTTPGARSATRGHSSSPGTPCPCSRTPMSIVDAERFERCARQALARRAATDCRRSGSRGATCGPGTCCPRTRTRRGWRTRGTGCVSCTRRCCGAPAGGRSSPGPIPADEEASLALARRLADSGDRRGALRQLERLERALRGELGVEPGPGRRRAAHRAARPRRSAPESARSACATAAGPRRRAQPDRTADRRGERRPRAGRCSCPGPRASARPPCCGGWTDRPRTAACASGVGTAAAIEGAWPYAPVLEASPTCADATPRCSTAWPTSTASRSRGRCAAPPRSGPARAVTSGCSSVPPSCCGSRRRRAARCSSSTTPTTPTRPVCGCCTTCPGSRSASGSSSWSRTGPGRSGRRWRRCAAA